MTANRPLWSGVLGSMLIAASSWWVAAVPVTFRGHRSGVLAWFPIGGAVPRVTYYLGLTVLSAAWLLLGRRILRGEPTPNLRRLAAWWALPLLAAVPLGRDLWAYAAQGNLYHHGLDPYAHGPADLPGAYSDEVSPLWSRSTTPYGPLWMLVSRLAVPASGEHVVATALLLRLPAMAGLLLWLWALPRLAQRIGSRRTDVAIWLGAACPLTIVLGVGGGHNDLLMTGLMVAGVAVAARGGSLLGLAWGGAILGLAVAVKSPAAVAVAFAVPIWLSVAAPRRPDVRTVATASAAALSGAVIAFGAASLASGLGLGWTQQASTRVTVVSWLSVPTLVAMLVKLASGSVAGATMVDATMRAIRGVGEVIAAASAAVLWWVALRRFPLSCLTAALGIIALLVPAVQPWYFCWALAFAGLVVSRRSGLVALAAVAITPAVLVRPNGQGLEMKPVAIPIVAGCVAMCWLALRTGPSTFGGSPPDDHRAEHAGTQVRSDDGPEF